MIELKIQLDAIDYEQAVEQLLPVLLGSLTEAEGDAGIFLKLAAKLPPKMVAKMFSVLPQATKDDLVVTLVNAKKDSLIQTLTQLARDKGVPLELRDLRAETR